MQANVSGNTGKTRYLGAAVNAFFVERGYPVLVQEVTIESKYNVLRFMRLARGEDGKPELKDFELASPASNRLQEAFAVAGLTRISVGKGKTYAQARAEFGDDVVIATFAKESAILEGAGDLTLMTNVTVEKLSAVLPGVLKGMRATFG